MQRSLLAGLMAVAALVMAGCTGTGNFDVQQTEPFRVQLEGEPQTIVVSEDDNEAQVVEIETCPDPCDDDDDCVEPCETGSGGDDGDQCATDCAVNVKIEVKQVSSAACVIKIIIKDKATGEVLDEREVDTGLGDDDDDDEDDGGSTTSATATGSATMTTTTAATGSAGGDTNVVVQNIVVNVKGKDNIVVLTQAIEGSADVDISAARASGNGEVDMDDEDDDMPTSSSTTTTPPY